MRHFIISVQENALLICNAESGASGRGNEIVDKRNWISLSNDSMKLSIVKVKEDKEYKEDVVCDGILGVYTLSNGAHATEN